jgi:hypothetical protein
MFNHFNKKHIYLNKVELNDKWEAGYRINEIYKVDNDKITKFIFNDKDIFE